MLNSTALNNSAAFTHAVQAAAESLQHLRHPQDNVRWDPIMVNAAGPRCGAESYASPCRGLTRHFQSPFPTQPDMQPEMTLDSFGFSKKTCRLILPLNLHRRAPCLVTVWMPSRRYVLAGFPVLENLGGSCEGRIAQAKTMWRGCFREMARHTCDMCHMCHVCQCHVVATLLPEVAQVPLRRESAWHTKIV